MRVKEENKRAGLKLSIQKMKNKASDPITSWKREGEKVEAVTLFSSSPKSLWRVTGVMKLGETFPLEGKL